MPADPKLLDALCTVLADRSPTGTVAINDHRSYSFLDFGDPHVYVMVGDTFPVDGPPRKLGPAPLNDDHVMTLVNVCDAYLSLSDAIVANLSGARPHSQESRAAIVAAREVLRARL